MSTLIARAISVDVHGRRLVDRVDVDVDAGSLTAIVGRNGAGKSTLLRVLAGELRPSSGAIDFLGRPLADHGRRALARHRAFVRQSTALSADLDVLDTVLLGRSAHAVTPGALDEAIARRALASVGMDAFVDRAMGTLSGGEAQRVHFARALAQLQPEGRLLLLDEPVASLDLAHQHRLLGACLELTGRGVAVIAVLHDLALAARYADRLLVLDAGRSVAEGPPDRVLSRALLRDVFGMEGDVFFRPGLPPLVDLRQLVPETKMDRGVASIEGKESS